jgi:hypothetical protein
LLLLLVPGYENTMAWLLFPLAAAMNFGYLLLLWIWSLATFSSCWSPDRKTPWQWRTEKPQNCTPKNA